MPSTQQASPGAAGDTHGKEVSGEELQKDEGHNRSKSQPTPDPGFRTVDKYVAKRIDAWALLEAKRKGLRPALKIRMTYPPKLVASEQPKFERALWRARAIERQSRLVIGGKPGEVLTEMIFSVIVYLLGVLDSCHSMPETNSRHNDNGTRGMTRAEHMDKVRRSRRWSWLGSLDSLAMLN
jgi:hypothetical protein